MIVIRGRAVTLSLLALAWVLGGCAQIQNVTEPTDVAQTASPSPSVAVTQAPTEPAVPTAGVDRSPAGATEFVRYWFATLAYAAQSGDVGPLGRASTDDCRGCRAAIETVQQSYSDGGRLDGGAYSLQDVQPSVLASGGLISVSVIFDRSPRSALSPVGEVRGSLPGIAFAQCELRLVWAGKAWKVRALQAETSII